MEQILTGLNEAQRTAVSSPADVLQVLAPPGSGKTKTLTARVAYLIGYKGLDPGTIIVCTFTVKAAREMKERIGSFLGDHLADRLILGTFHSIARRFLVKYGTHIGLKRDFGIADASDSRSLIDRIIKQLNLTISSSVARHRISGLKANGVTAEQEASKRASASDEAAAVYKQELDMVYLEYEAQLKTSNLLDYDDLLVYCRRLLETRPGCVSDIEAVLIDEFQDTNYVQYDLMTLFARQRRVITIVGDPDQSIYGWRSAKTENLVKMQQQYPDLHLVNLEENYRSSSCILMSAQAIIDQDTQRHQKSLSATLSVGERPVLRALKNAHVEANWICFEMSRCKALTGGLLKWSDFAVLLRSAFLSRLIETALAQEGIPYRMVGGHRFFDRAEVKLVLDYLRCLDHEDHTEAMTRIINTPLRGVGDASLQRLQDEAARRRQSLWTIVLGVAQGNVQLAKVLGTGPQKGLEQFVNLMLRAQKKLVNNPYAPLTEIIEWLIDQVGLRQHLEKTYTRKEDSDARWANVQELVALASEASPTVEPSESPEAKGSSRSSKPTNAEQLSQFLANIALSTDSKQNLTEGEDGFVTLSTMHAAKGLEWPVVFVPAAYSGSIPHSRAEDNDEERRLLYVAMTRAQGLLYLSYPRKDSKKEKANLSPFLTPQVKQTCIDHGPSFGYDFVAELARILRREGQSLDIARGRATFEYHRDDIHTQYLESGRNGWDEVEVEDVDSSDEDGRKYEFAMRPSVGATVNRWSSATTKPRATDSTTTTTQLHQPRNALQERTTQQQQQQQQQLTSGAPVLMGFTSARALLQLDSREQGCHKENKVPARKRRAEPEVKQGGHGRGTKCIKGQASIQQFYGSAAARQVPAAGDATTEKPRRDMVPTTMADGQRSLGPERVVLRSLHMTTEERLKQESRQGRKGSSGTSG